MPRTASGKLPRHATSDHKGPGTDHLVVEALLSKEYDIQPQKNLIYMKDNAGPLPGKIHLAHATALAGDNVIRVYTTAHRNVVTSITAAPTAQSPGNSATP